MLGNWQWSGRSQCLWQKTYFRLLVNCPQSSLHGGLLWCQSPSLPCPQRQIQIENIRRLPCSTLQKWFRWELCWGHHYSDTNLFLCWSRGSTTCCVHLCNSICLLYKWCSFWGFSLWQLVISTVTFQRITISMFSYGHAEVHFLCFSQVLSTTVSAWSS